MTDTEKAALERRIDELCAEVERLKEREQSLVVLLHNDCDIEASWDGLRKFWYIGLTESGCLMRDRACKAEAENARLRRLVRDIMRFFDDGDWCTACEYASRCDELDYEDDCHMRGVFRDRMRALGIDA